MRTYTFTANTVNTDLFFGYYGRFYTDSSQPNTWDPWCDAIDARHPNGYTTFTSNPEPDGGPRKPIGQHGTDYKKYRCKIYFGANAEELDHIASLPDGYIVSMELSFHAAYGTYRSEFGFYWDTALEAPIPSGQSGGPNSNFKSNHKLGGLRHVTGLSQNNTKIDVKEYGIPSSYSWLLHYVYGSYAYMDQPVTLTIITNELPREIEKTYTFNLTPYGVKTDWGYLSNFNFNQSNSSNWVGYERGWPDTTVFQNYGTGLAGNIQVGGTIQSISLTVNYSSQHNKGIAICKKTGAGINNYGYQSLGVEKVATGGSTSFTIDLTNKGICQYGYFLYQPDYNTYSPNVYTINSAVLTVVTLETSDLSVLIYDDNGGDGGPGVVSEETTTLSYTFTISSTAPVKLGCQFLGWALTSSASVPTLQPGNTITVNAGNIVTIYAVWKTLNTIRIVNNNNLDIYLVYIVENNNLVPYQVNIVDENGNLVICT